MIRCVKCEYKMSNTSALIEGTIGIFKSIFRSSNLVSGLIENEISAAIANQGNVKCPKCDSVSSWEDV